MSDLFYTAHRDPVPRIFIVAFLEIHQHNIAIAFHIKVLLILIFLRVVIY